MPNIWEFSGYLFDMVRKHTWYDLNNFTSIDICFMAYRMVCTGKIFHMYLKRVCNLLLLGKVFHKCQLDQVGWLYSSSIYNSFWFYVFWSISNWDGDVKISDYNGGSVYFLLLVLCFWFIDFEANIWLLKAALLGYNLHVIKFIHFKCTIQWFLANL